MVFGISVTFLHEAINNHNSNNVNRRCVLGKRNGWSCKDESFQFVNAFGIGPFNHSANATIINSNKHTNIGK